MQETPMTRKTASLVARTLSAGILFVVCAGCTQTIARFGTVSIEPVDQKAKYTLVGRNAVGKDLVTIIWVIPLGGASIEKATKNLLNQYDADYVDHLEIKQYFFWTYFFGKTGYIVTGNAYRKVRDNDTTENVSNYRLYKSNKGNVLVERPKN
jgi:hypothetical protein